MKSGKCVKCGGGDILVGFPPIYGGHGSSEITMAFTADPRWVYPGRNPDYPHGRFKCYVCRTCGYAEWYVEQPMDIPVGDSHSTYLLADEPNRGEASGSQEG